jgi:hypothetical protein
MNLNKPKYYDTPFAERDSGRQYAVFSRQFTKNFIKKFLCRVKNPSTFSKKIISPCKFVIKQYNNIQYTNDQSTKIKKETPKYYFNSLLKQQHW